MTSSGSDENLEAIYEFVAPSYGWLAQRYEAVNGRIQTAAAFLTSIAFAAIVVASSLIDDPAYNTWRFYGAMAFVVTGLILAAIGRWWGDVKLLNPEVLTDYAGLPSADFRRKVIDFAGQAFSTNKKTIWWKSICADGVTACLFGMAAMLSLWVVTQL